MARYHVTCINKHPTHQDRHHRIQYIGGTWGKHSEATAIQQIETRASSYYTTGGGSEAQVIVVSHPSGKKYLKTAADSTTRDNLLSLPECR
jgi:Protein of unknown function (DUF3892)